MRKPSPPQSPLPTRGEAREEARQTFPAPLSFLGEGLGVKAGSMRELFRRHQGHQAVVGVAFGAAGTVLAGDQVKHMVAHGGAHIGF